MKRTFICCFSVHLTVSPFICKFVVISTVKIIYKLLIKCDMTDLLKLYGYNMSLATSAILFYFN